MTEAQLQALHSLNEKASGLRMAWSPDNKVLTGYRGLNVEFRASLLCWRLSEAEIQLMVSARNALPSLLMYIEALRTQAEGLEHLAAELKADNDRLRAVAALGKP